MKRILIALDASPAAAHVLRRGAELAATSQAKVRLLRVIDPVGDTNVRMAAAEADLLRLAERLPVESRDGIVVDVGAAAENIVRVAQQYRADTIVLGARGDTWGSDGLGGVATEVLHRADRHVHVVRPMRRGGRDEEVVPPPSFVPLEAAAVSGAVAGAVAGAIAGPPGAIVGGTIGLAVGALAGSALEMTDQATSRHEGELDEAIGVVGGDLGAKEMARAGTLAIERSIAERHHDEHLRLEVLYGGLVEAYRNGDWSDVRRGFAELESAVRRHLEVEEKETFPALGSEHPTEIARLVEEHTQIRESLDAIAMAIELHVAGLTRAEELLRRLREHAAHEERLLYPWLETGISPAA